MKSQEELPRVGALLVAPASTCCTRIGDGIRAVHGLAFTSGVQRGGAGEALESQVLGDVEIQREEYAHDPDGCPHDGGVQQDTPEQLQRQRGSRGSAGNA